MKEMNSGGKLPTVDTTIPIIPRLGEEMVLHWQRRNNLSLIHLNIIRPDRGNVIGFEHSPIILS
jgi:hypothetical protein